jgi:hypothetical protein
MAAPQFTVAATNQPIPRSTPYSDAPYYSVPYSVFCIPYGVPNRNYTPYPSYKITKLCAALKLFKVNFNITRDQGRWGTDRKQGTVNLLLMMWIVWESPFIQGQVQVRTTDYGLWSTTLINRLSVMEGQRRGRDHAQMVLRTSIIIQVLPTQLSSLFARRYGVHSQLLSTAEYSVLGTNPTTEYRYGGTERSTVLRTRPDYQH